MESVIEKEDKAANMSLMDMNIRMRDPPQREPTPPGVSPEEHDKQRVIAAMVHRESSFEGEDALPKDGLNDHARRTVGKIVEEAAVKLKIKPRNVKVYLHVKDEAVIYLMFSNKMMQSLGNNIKT